jgi:Cys-tRNA(Pro) deacylase
MAKPDYPITTAIRHLRDKKIDFVPHQYDYEEKGGTHQTSTVLAVPEHDVIKTLIMEDDSGAGLIVLMHGDREVSTKELARILSQKKVTPCDAKKAEKLTGYLFGGTSPFGTKSKMPVYVEESILACGKIFINGGKRGFIVEINPDDLRLAFDIQAVNVATEK